MKGDFTRTTFARAKHYSAVLMQQGRVQLDADWNEQNDIAAHRHGATANDTIGPVGAPIHDAGFAILAKPADLPAEDKLRPENANPPAMTGADLLVSGGRMYVAGELTENEHICLFSDQPHLPKGLPRVLASGNEAAFPPPAGSYLAYLDVWQRHLTALDDETIREVALGGADTATRKQTLWQVKLLQVAAATACDAVLPDWNTLIAPSTGKLAARAEPEEKSESVCVVDAGAGYRRLENQLYRVEVHGGGNALDEITIKWSRDNGTVAVQWTGKNGNDLLVASPGRDTVLAFAPGQWVELTDDTHEWAGNPGTLVKLANAQGTTLTVDLNTATGPLDFTHFPKNPKVRRWDMTDDSIKKADKLANADGWIPLEDGVQIKLSAGTLRTGDYWLIPARTATAKVEWPKSGETGFERTPFGIEHHYGRLAVVEFDEKTFKVVNDCRKLFPPLTELEDAESWHKRHNRYLHGWGVACGLKVHCDDERKFVKVSKGYAIACDGGELLLKSDSRFDVVSAAKAAKLIDNDGNAKLQLLLDQKPGGAPSFDLRSDPGHSKSMLEEVLEGTLLSDVWDDCVKPVIDFLGKELFEVKQDGTVLVPESAKNRIAALNLLVQLANKTEGANVFLSKDEHERLVKLYHRIKAFIEVKAYCGMFDGLVSPPAYPFDSLKIRTLYGNQFYTRVAVAPRGKMVYAVAPANKVHGFELGKDAASVEMTLPAVAGMNLTVQDVAALAEVIVVAASGPNGSALCLFDAEKHQPIGDPVTFEGRQIVRLGTSPSDRSAVYGLAKGQGLVRIDPKALAADASGKFIREFNATGELEMGFSLAAGYAIATSATANAGNTNIYTQLELVDLKGDDHRTISLRDQAGATVQGSDGAAVLLAAGIRGVKAAVKAPPASAFLYVVVDPAPGSKDKRLLVLEPLKGSTVATIALPTDGAVSLMATPSQDFMLAAMQERFLVARIDPKVNQFSEDLLFPAQIQPIAMAATIKGDAVLVVNRASASLGHVPAEVISARPGVNRQTLAEYRQAMLDAFRDLLSRLMQMMKDCACDRLLVECPECTDSDKVVLAGIEVKANKVHAICALQRKDVVTFPKFFYWLSAVPVIPLATKAVEWFCCLHLPEVASQFFKQTGNLVSAKDFAHSATLTKADFQAASEETLARSKLFARHVALSGTRDLLPKAGDATRVRANDVIAKSPEAVSRELAGQGFTVNKVADYDESLARNAFKEIGSVPLELKPGDKINLYTRGGQVVFFTREELIPAVGGEGVVAGADARVTQELTGLRREVEGLQKALAERDRQIASHNGTIERMGQVLTEFDDMKAQMAKLVPALKRPRKAMK